MKLNRILTIIGLVLVLVPLTDFSRSFKYSVSIVSGAVILYFGVNSIHMELKKKHGRKSHKHDSFVESKPQPPVELESEEKKSPDGPIDAKNDASVSVVSEGNNASAI
jgi:uncharacterized membrane protein